MPAYLPAWPIICTFCGSSERKNASRRSPRNFLEYKLECLLKKNTYRGHKDHHRRAQTSRTRCPEVEACRSLFVLFETTSAILAARENVVNLHNYHT